jgi:hypothetical protein
MDTSEALAQLVAPGGTWRDGSDFWKALCNLCAQQGVRSTSDFDRVCAKFERDYRSLTFEPMPAKHRSAKSILRKAIFQGVPYLQPDGFPRGKTAVDKDCY